MDSMTFNLKRMGMEECVPLFKENGIEMDTLMSMSPLVMQTLFLGKAALLAKFETKHREFKEKRLWAVPETQKIDVNISRNPRVLYPVFGINVKEECFLQHNEWISQEDPLGIERGSASERESSDEGEDEDSQTQFDPPGGDAPINSQRQDPETESEDDEPHSSASGATQSTTSTSSSSASNTTNNKRRGDRPGASSSNKRHATSNEVEDILNESALGKSVLSYKGSNKDLPPTVLAKLGELLVQKELGACINNVITPARFTQLATNCSTLFPAEPSERFYIPRKPAVGSLRAVQPRGVLYDKYHNSLRFLRQHGGRRSIRKGGQTADEDSDDDSALQSADITWLKEHSLESQRVTKEKWTRTTDERIRELRCAGDRKSKHTLDVTLLLSQYFETYPCLNQPWGLELILDDFEHLYGGKCVNIIVEWHTVKAKLLILLKKNNEDCGSAADLLRLIPRMFKQPTVFHGHGKKREALKPSMIEAQDGFLLHVKTNADVETNLERMKKRCGLVKKPLQPLPIVVGQSLSSIEACYVAIDKLRYRVQTPLEAMDACFKVYHALHATYPCQSSYSWQFLQQAVYNLDTPWDIDAPSVSAKVSQFKKIQL